MGEKKKMRYNLADTKLREEGRGGCAPVSCSPWRRPWWGSCPLAARGGPQWSRDPTAAGEATSNVGGCTLKKAVEKPCSSKLLTGTAGHREESMQSRFLGRTCEMLGNHSRAVCEKLQFIIRTHTGEVHKGQKLIGETPHSSRARAWGGRRRKDEEVWTDPNPYLISTWVTLREKGGKCF